MGIPALGYHVGWLVQDGNHRLAAAIYARRTLIPALVAGQLDHAQQLLGVDCTGEEGGETP